MSKSRGQTQKRRAMRVMFGNQSETNSTKITGRRTQIIEVKEPKKRGRKSKSQIIREKWLKRVPSQLFGEFKYIYHKV